MSTTTRTRLTTDLNLNATTPSRVQPKVGVWGPSSVPSTRRKKVMRILAWICFFLALAAVVGYGWWFYLQLEAAMKQAG